MPWLRKVAGVVPSYVFNNQRWVEIPDGFVPGTLLQPVRNLPNAPVSALNESSLGPGVWVEVTVPYADVTSMQNAPTRNSWVESASSRKGQPLRLYYGQVFWVGRDPHQRRMVRCSTASTPIITAAWICCGHAAEAFRHSRRRADARFDPDVEDKRVEVHVTYQTLSCSEGEPEVYLLPGLHRAQSSICTATWSTGGPRRSAAASRHAQGLLRCR